MKKGVAAIAIFLQILALFVKATVLQYTFDVFCHHLKLELSTFKMKKGVAAIAIFLQILALFVKATVLQSIDPKDVATIDGRRYYFSSILVTSTDYYCTSGTRHHSMWIWGNSGEPFSHFKWDVGQPDGRTDEYNTNIPEAVTVCQELNMTLAGFETVEEYDAVMEYIRIDLASNEIYWTSGILQYNMWIWGNSGKPFSYFKWDVNEPDSNTAEDTLCVKNGFMHNW
ncbi:hypothetical protein B566_EDAN010161, partial [Ephemera danica]